MALPDCQTEEKMNKDIKNNGKGKGKKKTTQIMATLVVVGGALVVGGLLMATFGIKRNKRRDFNKNLTTVVKKASQESDKGWVKRNEDQGRQGLLCLLQTTSPMANSSCEGRGNSTESVIIREQRLTTEIDGVRISKMVLPDSRGKEIINLSSDFGTRQDKKYNNEDPIPIEIIEEVTNNGETSAIEQDTEMYSAEDKEEENNSEGSEDTGDSSSSRESNSDAIWPAEMIEDTMPELEEACQPQWSKEENKTVQTEKHAQFNSDKVFNNYAREENTTIDEDISKFWVRIFSMLMLILFLLLIFPIPRNALSVVLSLFS